MGSLNLEKYDLRNC